MTIFLNKVLDEHEVDYDDQDEVDTGEIAPLVGELLDCWRQLSQPLLPQHFNEEDFDIGQKCLQLLLLADEEAVGWYLFSGFLSEKIHVGGEFEHGFCDLSILDNLHLAKIIKVEIASHEEFVHF